MPPSSTGSILETRIAQNETNLTSLSPTQSMITCHSVRVPAAYGHQTIRTLKSIRSPEHPCPNHNNVCVPRARGHQSIHAQTTQRFSFGLKYRTQSVLNFGQYVIMMKTVEGSIKRGLLHCLASGFRLGFRV